jgi:hypothetical protein
MVATAPQTRMAPVQVVVMGNHNQNLRQERHLQLRQLATQ